MTTSNSIRMILDPFGKGACTSALFLLLTTLQVALAHGGFEHVMGTVTKISANSVTVETTSKKIVEVGLNAKTAYTRGSLKVTAADMNIGDRVVIHATEVNEKLTAATISLGTRTTSEHAEHSGK